MARFEYRIFIDDPSPFADRMGDQLQSAGSKSTRDIYLIDSERLRHNLKLRDGCLQVKEMDEERDGMQRWQPRGEHGFPLPKGVIDRWFPQLEATDGPSSGALTDSAEQAGYRVVEIAKSRLNYQRDELLAEITRITGRNLEVDSVAAEHADPDVLARWIARLGLRALPNRSYIQYLATVGAHGHGR